MFTYIASKKITWYNFLGRNFVSLREKIMAPTAEAVNPKTKKSMEKFTIWVYNFGEQK